MSTLVHSATSEASSPATLVNMTPPITISEAGHARAIGTNGNTAHVFPSSLPLPHEALLLIFQFLHEQHTSYIHSCMLVCKSWRKLIINEPRFWYRLHLDLDMPEKAKEKTQRHISRCFRSNLNSSPGSSSPSPQFANATDTGQPPPPSLLPSSTPSLLSIPISLLDLSFTYLNSRKSAPTTGRQPLASRLKSCVDAILNVVQMHLSDLSSLSIHVVGDDPLLLLSVLNILLLQVSRRLIVTATGDFTDGPKLSNAKHISLDLASIHGLPLARDCLAYFEGAHSITIRGNRPFQDHVRIEPELEAPPQEVARIMQLQVAYPQVCHFNEKNIGQYRKYEALARRYHSDLADHRAYGRLEALDWELFHFPNTQYLSNGQPTQWGEAIHVNTQCDFGSLSSMNLFGCTISDNLVLPQDGFPNLRHLVVTSCKWGKGLWDFLGASPSLRSLEMQNIMWNQPPPDDEDDEDLVHEVEEDDIDSESPASTLANEEDLQDMTYEGTCPQTPEADLYEEETPPYIRPVHAVNPAPEPNYIIDNSFITILGDDSHPIYEFDEDLENEDIDAAYNEIIDSLSTWCKQEAIFTYPEDLCYPPEIDTGSSWTVITKPIHTKSWKRAAGFNYHHRVITHFDDQAPQEHDIVSEFDWVTLQKRRKAERDQDDTASVTSSLAYRDLRQPRSTKKQAPPAILLAKLHTFKFTGGTYQPVWANTKFTSRHRRVHPALYMPNVKQVSLSYDRSLSSTRLAWPLAEVHTKSLKCGPIHPEQGEDGFKRPTRITSEEYDEALYQLEEGDTAVFGEPTDQELFDMMSDGEAEYYALQPWKLHEYRHEWRVNKGLYTEDGVADERVLLALMTGASRIEPLPYAGTALAATALNLTSLDLSYTNISPAVFLSMMKYHGQLRELSLSGVITLQDADLRTLGSTCPRLVYLDISSCGTRLTARGAVYVVDRIRHDTRNKSRLSKIKVDDPWTIIWPTQLSVRHYEASCYLYLDFLGLLIDEEVELWLESMRNGIHFSKKPGKQRLQLRYA